MNPRNMNMNMDMEFGVFTFIVPDTIFNSIKKYTGYELVPDQNSQLLFTYDNEPDIVKEFDIKTDHKMEKMCYSSRRIHVFTQTFQLQTKKGPTLFFQDVLEYSPERDAYVLKSLKPIFRYHSQWANSKPSLYNCVYFINDPTKQNTFAILKIGSNRYLFAYHPKYLFKHDVEQIIFDLFIS